MNALTRLALATAALLTSTYGALAHADLKAQDPPAEARVYASPNALSLDFSEGLEIGFSGVTLKAADGKSKMTGTAALSAEDDKRMIVPLDGPLTAGTYTVEWHVLSKDGHATHGAYRFAVGP